MSKKIGFALSAGGSRGCAHIGFLMAMEESGGVEKEKVDTTPIEVTEEEIKYAEHCKYLKKNRCCTQYWSKVDGMV